MQLIKPSRRGLLTGAAAMAAYAALGSDPASAVPFVVGTAYAHVAPGGASSAINTTGANYFCLTQSYYFPSGAGPPTDSKSNTWVLVQHETSGSGYRVDMYECFNPTTDPAHTFSGANVNNFTLCIAAYSGAVSGGSGLGTNLSTTTAATIQPGSLTPGQTNTLILTGIISQDSVAATYALNQGFTVRENIPPAAAATEGGALGELWQGAAAAVNPTWSGMSGSSEMAAVIMQVPMTSGPPSLTTKKLMFRPIP